MKKYYKTIGILVLALIIFGYNIILKQEQSYEQLIVGTWVEENGTYQNRYEFQENYMVTDYYKNQVYKTFTWQISPEPTPSGLTISYLILTNNEDPDDKYEYQIVGISNEEMRLQYQRSGWGPGKITLYIKQ